VNKEYPSVQGSSALKGVQLSTFIGRYLRGASSKLSPNLDLVAWKLLVARKHSAFNNFGFSKAKAIFKQMLSREWGHAIARGWVTLLLDR